MKGPLVVTVSPAQTEVPLLRWGRGENPRQQPVSIAFPLGKSFSQSKVKACYVGRVGSGPVLATSRSQLLLFPSLGGRVLAPELTEAQGALIQITEERRGFRTDWTRPTGLRKCRGLEAGKRPELAEGLDPLQPK